MPQRAPLQWVLCFFIFLFFYQVVIRKMWFYGTRSKFLFVSPFGKNKGVWDWS